jgi:hypothetical protein
MASSLWDTYSACLTIIVMIAATTDFLIGKKGAKCPQNWLADLWLRLEVTGWRSFGPTEAESFIRFYEALFGRKLFSAKRLVSCLLLVLFCYILSALSLDWSELTATFSNKSTLPAYLISFVLDTVSTSIFVEITRVIFYLSRGIARSLKYSSAAFILLVLISFLSAYGVSYYLIRPGMASIAMVLGDALGPHQPYENYSIYEFWLRLTVSTREIYSFEFDEGNFNYQYFLRSIVDPELLMDNLAIAGVVAGSASGLVAWLSSIIRIIFAAAFLVLWLFVRPLRWISSLILLRFAELNKGVLTTFAAALAGIAKIIQLVIEKII